MTERNCIVLKGFGGYDMLKIEKQPFPNQLSYNEVQVKVKACGLNFADIYQRQGLLVDTTIKPPFVMGMECSGVVERVGNEVTSLKKGDKVMCYNSKGGMYSDIVILSVDKCFLMPESMTFDEGAAFLVNYLTAYFALFDFGNLQTGQAIFCHAIAGGVGCAITQLAKTVPDVKVFGTASKGKADAAKINGASNVFEYSSFHTSLSEICPEGVDIFVDNLSGNEFTSSFAHLNGLGKLIHIGANSVITGEKRNFFALLKAFWGLKNVSVLQLITKNHAVCGLHLANLFHSNPERIAAVVNKLCQLYKAGNIKPQLDSTWNFNQIVNAMQRIAKRENVGKVIVHPE